MQPKRYHIKDGVLRFENSITVFEDYLKVPNTVVAIDFNEVEHLRKPLHLEHTDIVEIDFKNVITVDTVYLPPFTLIKENLYWAEHFITHAPTVESSRLLYLGLYDYRELVYLSGTVSGHLPLRAKQASQIFAVGYGVYSPGNHITFGDPVADKYPSIVGEIDIKALEKCNIIFFDLNNLSPGTCAELGYVVAKEWYKTKRIYYMFNDNPNFFIRHLLTKLTRVSSLEEFLGRDQYEKAKYEPNLVDSD